MCRPKDIEGATQVVESNSSWDGDDDICIPLGGFDDILNWKWQENLRLNVWRGLLFQFQCAF